MDLFLQYFLAPTITAFLISLGQLYLIPKLEKKKITQAELWKEKKQVFIEALELVNDIMASLFDEEMKKEMTGKLKKVNNTQTKLIILSENQSIPETFADFFDKTKQSPSPAQRAEFMINLRKELGLECNLLNPEEIRFFA